MALTCVPSAALLALLAALAAAPAPAQVQVQAPPEAPSAEQAERDARLRALGETYRRAPDESQDPQELVRTRILNAENLAQNGLAENQDQADRAAHEAGLARHSEAVSRAHTERLNHEAEARASEAAQIRYEADMAAWRARVRACETGDRRTCEGR